MVIVLTRRVDGHVAILLDGHVVVDDGGGHAVVAGGVRVALDGPVVALGHGITAALVDDLDGVTFAPPRSLLDEREGGAELLGAVAYGQWYARARCCQTCGRPLGPGGGGDGRVLACGSGHQWFPQIEPAVIVRVVDEDDRILLARAPHWPQRQMSVLAGFVEPGETLEDTVHREVREEVGLGLVDLAYVASQPWPFPASLMVAFTATATTTELRLQDDEIASARWFSRDALRAAVAASEVRMPPPLSIAHRLIHAWFDEQPGATSPASG